jgi:hypothetical protein
VLRAALPSLLASLALAVAVCGGDDGASGGGGADPEQYAADVCGAIANWQKELQSSASTMQSKLGTASTPADVKTELVGFMEGATKATDKMLAEVKEAGPPDVENGEALQRDLEKGLTAAQTAFASARDDAKNLPTDNPATFGTEAQKLGTTLSEEGSKIGQTFNGLSTKYDSKELNSAFDREPACKSL